VARFGEDWLRYKSFLNSQSVFHCCAKILLNLAQSCHEHIIIANAKRVNACTLRKRAERFGLRRGSAAFSTERQKTGFTKRRPKGSLPPRLFRNVAAGAQTATAREITLTGFVIPGR